MALPIIYLDCSAGIAGDMLLGALLDLGADVEAVRHGLTALGLGEPWRLDVQPAMRRGIKGLRALVRVNDKPADAVFRAEGLVDKPHAHEGHAHDHGAGHHDYAHHEHSHEPPHPDELASHHEHRPYKAIRALLERAELPARAKARAQAVFAALAEAEGAVHGVSPDEVHFHEVGSTDAIIDVVGCCLALETLDVDAVEASPLHLGRGYVRAAHGRMPIPAPATLRLLEGLSAYQTDVEGELTTPTGAALVRGLCRRVGPMPPLRIERVGHGAGARDGVLPNVVRAVLGEPAQPAPALAWATPPIESASHESASHESPTPTAGTAPPSSLPTAGADAGFARDHVRELACNLDDATPQLLGALAEQFLAEGALDVWIEPVLMKKGRPGHVLHVLAQPDDEPRLAALLLRESTSLGVRVRSAERWMLQRKWHTVKTAGGEVRVKIGFAGSTVYNVAPEYEDCRVASERAGVPLKRLMDEARARALALWSDIGSDVDGSH